MCVWVCDCVSNLIRDWLGSREALFVVCFPNRIFSKHLALSCGDGWAGSPVKAPVISAPVSSQSGSIFINGGEALSGDLLTHSQSYALKAEAFVMASLWGNIKWLFKSSWREDLCCAQATLGTWKLWFESNDIKRGQTGNFWRSLRKS